MHLPQSIALSQKVYEFEEVGKSQHPQSPSRKSSQTLYPPV